MQTSEKLFAGNAAENIRNLSEKELLDSLDGVPLHRIPRARIDGGMDVVTLLAESGIFPSKGEARKTVQGGGVSINKDKVGDVGQQIDASSLLHNRYLLVQKGKKNYYLVIAE